MLINSSSAATTPQIAWTKMVCPESWNSACALAMDRSGNVYINSTFEQLTQPTDGRIRGYVAKYDPEGNLLWQNVSSSISGYYMTGLAVDSTGNVFASAGPIINKFSPSGKLLWNSPLEGYGTSIATDPDGNAYIAGQNAFIAGTFLPVFVSKINSSGNLLWTTQLGSHAFSYINNIAVDASGNAVIAGADYNGNTDEGFVTKVNAFGNIEWHQQFSGLIGSVAIDSAGSTYLNTLNNLIKYDSTNQQLWSTKVTNYSSIGAIAIDPNGTEYVNGGQGIFKVDSFGNLQDEMVCPGLDLPVLAFGNGRLSIAGFKSLFPDRNPTNIINIIVPEPSTLILLGMSAFGLLAWAWRRNRKVA
jgi:hypothetical protein